MHLQYALTLLLVLAASCDRSSPRVSDPNYREPFISGALYRVEYYDRSVDYLRDVEVIDAVGLRMVPQVSLNEVELRPYFYSPGRYRYGDEDQFRVYRPYKLSVIHYWGEAFSRVLMPGNFELTAPATNYIHDLESTLVITWRPSAGAQWYWVDLYCDFEFLDSNGVWDDFSFDLDTVVHDTILAVPPGRVFPSEVMELVEGDGSALVVAAYGPEIEPGDLGNIRGAGFGFFTAGNEPRERYFYIGAPPSARRTPTPADRRGRFLNRATGRCQIDSASVSR
jgi:hypothetical protein